MSFRKCSLKIILIPSDIDWQKPRTRIVITPPPPPTPTPPRLSPNLCIPLKILACLSKHLPVFLLGTENIVGGGVDGNTGSGLWSNLW